MSREALLDAQFVVRQCDRWLGGYLADREKAKGGQPYQKSTGNTALPVETLEDLDVTKNQSSRWQQEVAVPEADFNARVEGVRAPLNPVDLSRARNLQ